MDSNPQQPSEEPRPAPSSEQSSQPSPSPPPSDAQRTPTEPTRDAAPRMSPELPQDPSLYQYRREAGPPMKKFLILGLILAVAVIALWANRSYYFGNEKPSTPGRPRAAATPKQPETIPEDIQKPQQKPMTEGDKYAYVFSREMEKALGDFFSSKGRLYLTASPSQYRQEKKGGIQILPGHAFDITNRIDSFRPELMFRGPRPCGVVVGLGAENQPPIKFVAPDKVLCVEDKDIVFGVTNGKVSKAYSLKILNYHEIVNDKLGDTPIAIFWSPFSYLVTGFVRKAKNKELSFNPSGRIYFGLSVPYDFQTESLWNPLTGEALSGEMAGQKLKPISVTMCTWAAWKKAHPETLVLSGKSGVKEYNYFFNIYADNDKQEHNYFKIDGVWFPAARFYPDESVLRPKVQVLFVMSVKPPVAVALKDIEQFGHGKLTFNVDGKKMTFVYDKAADHAYVTDENGREILAYRIMWYACKGFRPETRLLRPAGLPTRKTPPASSTSKASEKTPPEASTSKGAGR